MVEVKVSGSLDIIAYIDTTIKRWIDSLNYVPYQGLEINASRFNSCTVSTVKQSSATTPDHCVWIKKAKQANTVGFCLMCMIVSTRLQESFFIVKIFCEMERRFVKQ
jgi:hypothetical protein